MATFPIEYAETVPSARIPAVYAPEHIETGTQAIVRGIGALGAAFENVAAAKRSIDFSTKKRQIEEISMAAVNAYKTTGDPKAQEALEDKWSKDIDAITSDDPILNDELVKYKNQVLPDWGQTFANHKLANQARQNKDAFESNQIHLKEIGAVGEARKQLWNYQRTTNQISEAEAIEMDKNMPIDSVFAQSRINIGNNLHESALMILTDPEFRKQLSGDQLDYADKLTRMAQQSQKQNDDVFGKTILKEMLAADVAEVSPSERAINALDMRNRVLDPNNGLSLEQARTLNNNIAEWEKGEDPQTDEAELNRLDNLINEYHAGRYTRSQLETLFMQKRFIEKKIGNSAFRKLNEDLDKAIKDFHGKMLSDISAESRQQLVSFSDEAGWERFAAMLSDKDRKNESNKRQTEFWHASMYVREMRDWMTKNPDATEDQVYIKRTGLMRNFRKRTLTEIERLREEEELKVSEIPEGLEVIWNELSDTGKQRAKEAIAAGRKPEDIVGLYYGR